SRGRHTRFSRDWSSDVCSSDLAIARISGETAPLLFTALNNQFMSMIMNAPIANLPVVIFQYAASPFEDWNRLAWAGAVLITLLRSEERRVGKQCRCFLRREQCS